MVEIWTVERLTAQRTNNAFLPYLLSQSKGGWRGKCKRLSGTWLNASGSSGAGGGHGHGNPRSSRESPILFIIDKCLQEMACLRRCWVKSELLRRTCLAKSVKVVSSKTINAYVPEPKYGKGTQPFECRLNGCPEFTVYFARLSRRISSVCRV